MTNLLQTEQADNYIDLNSSYLKIISHQVFAVWLTRLLLLYMCACVCVCVCVVLFICYSPFRLFVKRNIFIKPLCYMYAEKQQNKRNNTKKQQTTTVSNSCSKLYFTTTYLRI